MCSEALWWRCHRRIMPDYLLFSGHDLAHLMAPGRTERAPGVGVACASMEPCAIPSRYTCCGNPGAFFPVRVELLNQSHVYELAFSLKHRTSEANPFCRFVCSSFAQSLSYL